MPGSRFFEKFMENRSLSTAEKIMMCAFIALSGTFYFYDYYQSFSAVARVVITVLIFAVWFYCAFSAGKDKQFGFVVFGYLYWVIPFAYTIYYNSRDNVKGYSKWLSLCNKIADMLLVKPFEYIAEKTGNTPLLFACLVLAGTTLLFAAGFIVRFIYDKNVHELQTNEQTCDEAHVTNASDND